MEAKRGLQGALDKGPRDSHYKVTVFLDFIVVILINHRDERNYPIARAN
jgi:hypothetical protein